MLVQWEDAMQLKKRLPNWPESAILSIARILRCRFLAHPGAFGLAERVKGIFMHKVICVLLLSMMAAQAGLSKLDAISMIESGNNDFAIGGAGEVSRYQIKPRVWRSYTDREAYENQKLSGWVAGQYLSFLESAFEKGAGHPPTDFDLYVLWNAGLAYYKRIGFSSHRVLPVIRERAQRFVNLRQMRLATDPKPPEPAPVPPALATQ